MIPQLLKNSLKLRRHDHCEWFLAGTLLLVGAAGCSGARTGTHATAANPRPETRIGSSAAGGSSRAEADPGPADEYPDFRGRGQTSPGPRGPSLPPSAAPGAPAEDLSEPPPFPGVDQQNDGGPAASLSPRGAQRSLLAAAARRPEARSVAMPVSERHPASAAMPPRSVTGTASRPSPVTEPSTEPLFVPVHESRRIASKPPEWSLRFRSGREVDFDREPQILAGGPTVTNGDSIPGSEPVRMDDPPRLNAPPSGSEAELLDAPSEGLDIAKLLICRQVRGFDDVVEFNAQGLRQGQPILIYAALEKFLSIATGEGYRTQTLSSLEIQMLNGDVLLRIPLGTAVDVAETPRQGYFLTHRVTIPDNLPSGPYVFELHVDDMQSREAARAKVHVTITADRSRQDETDGTSKFATRPDSFLR